MSAGKSTDAPTDAELQAAKRAIRRFNDPTLLPGDGVLNLYCSLRKCHGRVNPKLLTEHFSNTHELKQGCTVETTYWLVPKSNFQNGLPPRLAEFEVSPETVDKLLPQAQDIVLAQCHVLDKACDRAPPWQEHKTGPRPHKLERKVFSEGIDVDALELR